MYYIDNILKLTVLTGRQIVVVIHTPDDTCDDRLIKSIFFILFFFFVANSFGHNIMASFRSEPQPGTTLNE